MTTLRRLLRGRLALALLALSVFVISFVAGCASTGQPHMQSALDHLFSARSELQAASADKGGHRNRALELTDAAISEVQRGMDYARKH